MQFSYMMTPVDYLIYLFNSTLLGEELTVEDLILLVGTSVAFIAFILWCCFPVVPRDPIVAEGDAKYMQHKRNDVYETRAY